MLGQLFDRIRQPVRPPLFPPEPRDDRRGLDVRLPADELSRRAAAEHEFIAGMPKHPCRACRATDWQPLRSADAEGRGTGWRCRNCGRPPLDEAEWNAELAQRQARQAEEAKVAAANGTPAATRATLRVAITRRDEVAAELVALRAAEPRLAELVYAAVAARDAADGALKAAASDGERLLDAATIRDHDKTPALSRAELKRRLGSAEEALTGAREGRDLAARRADEAKVSLGLAEGNVRKAAVACMLAHSPQFLGDYLAATVRMQAELLARFAALDSLRRAWLYEPRHPGLETIASRRGVAPTGWSIAPFGDGGVAKVDAMLAGLCVDAAAPATLGPL